MHVSVRAEPAIVMVTHRGTAIVAHKRILLVISAPEELEGARVGPVAHSLQNHVVALLNGTEAHILHALDERQSASVAALSLVLEVHGECRLMVDIVATPQVH